MEKSVKIIKDFNGEEWEALVVIGRVAIVKNASQKYVQMFCQRSSYMYGSDNIEGWTFGSGHVIEHNKLQDACNEINPKNIL